jgi:hypothetical protein
MQVPPSSPATSGGSVTVVISVLAILVAGAVGLIVGYMQRKQMRQIEAYRQNPALGLVPPPHPVTAFMRANKYLVILSGGGLLLVFLGFLSPRPITHLSVLIIAIGVSGFLYGLLLDLLDRVIRLLERICAVPLTDDKKPG